MNNYQKSLKIGSKRTQIQHFFKIMAIRPVCFKISTFERSEKAFVDVVRVLKVRLDVTETKRMHRHHHHHDNCSIS